MKPKTMILMVVAVSCGLGASYMTSRLLADRQQEVEKVTILVAKKIVNAGDPIKTPDEWFVEKQVPKGEEPRLAITEMNTLKGRIPKRSLRAGDFITPEDLHDERGGGGVAYNLPPGHVACGIRVRSEDIASGFAALPHSRVNILWTVRRGSDKESFCKILLENVLVLAADQQTVRNESGGAMPASVVTVALKHEDSMRLELAKSTGTLALALRKFGDVGSSEHAKVNMEDLRGSTGAAAEEPLETASPPPVTQPGLPPLPTPVKEPAPTVNAVEKGSSGIRHILTVIEGGEQRQVEYRLDEKTGRTIVPEIRRSPVNPPAPAVQPAPKKDDETPAGVN